VKAQRGQIEQALGAPQADQRLFLLHGPDESSSRELAARLGKALGPDVDRIDLTGPGLKADPARLSDEAASISLFGGARYILVDPAGDEILDAVTALLESPFAGNPVIAIAGTLRKDSKLLKLALASPLVLAFASYVPEGGDADRLAMTMARALGLKMPPDVARRLASATGGDRALLARELEKLALFVDALPGGQAEIDHEALDALGAATDEGDLGRLVNTVLSGHPDRADAELAALAGEAIEGIPVIRALLRRLLLLAQLRAETAQGKSLEAVMASAGNALFWKEKDEVARQIARWDPETIAAAINRLGEAERLVKASGSPGPIAVEEELLTISRRAARMR
jgi:DNA polymerase-3 subunit delta